MLGSLIKLLDDFIYDDLDKQRYLNFARECVAPFLDCSENADRLGGTMLVKCQEKILVQEGGRDRTDMVISDQKCKVFSLNSQLKSD